MLLVLAFCSCVLGYIHEFWQFFLVSSLCNVRRDVTWCALLVLRPSWKHFRAVCFPFETQSGSLLLLAFCEFSFGPVIITSPLRRLPAPRLRAWDDKPCSRKVCIAASPGKILREKVRNEKVVLKVFFAKVSGSSVRQLLRCKSGLKHGRRHEREVEVAAPAVAAG